jgi:hypothetical protein
MLSFTNPLHSPPLQKTGWRLPPAFNLSLLDILGARLCIRREITNSSHNFIEWLSRKWIRRHKNIDTWWTGPRANSSVAEKLIAWQKMIPFGLQLLMAQWGGLSGLQLFCKVQKPFFAALFLGVPGRHPAPDLKRECFAWCIWKKHPHRHHKLTACRFNFFTVVEQRDVTLCCQ